MPNQTIPQTVPNQRVVTVHRDDLKSDFLGIQNTNWQAAARDLGAHALLLYLYFAANRDGYSLALSPTAITNAIGMPRQTYRDQFRKLLAKGYLVETGGNRYAFYEVPHAPRMDTETGEVFFPTEDTEATGTVPQGTQEAIQTTNAMHGKQHRTEDGFYFDF